MTWHDPSLSTATADEANNGEAAVEDQGVLEQQAVLDDALAVQFPTKISDGAVRPYFLRVMRAVPRTRGSGRRAHLCREASGGVGGSQGGKGEGHDPVPGATG